MENKGKIKISYEELADENVDKIIARRSKKLSAINDRRLSLIKSFIARKWFYIIIALIICFFIGWGILKIFELITSPKEKYYKMADSKCSLSDEMQKYLKTSNKSGLDFVLNTTPEKFQKS